MSDTTKPAGKTGGDTTTTISAALADLPARIRIHALAKLLGRNSREVLAVVTEAGVTGRSVQSSIDKEVALKVAESFGVPAESGEPVTEQRAEAPGQPPARQVPPTPVFASAAPVFRPPEQVAPPSRREPEPADVEAEETSDEGPDTDEDTGDDSRPRRRRGRRGRGRGKGGQGEDGADGEDRSDEDRADQPGKDDKPADKPEKSDRRRGKAKADDADAEDDADDADETESASRRRRRRRRRKSGTDDENGPTEDDPPNTVVHVRESRGGEDKADSDGRDEVRSVRGSTRLEAKRQRRRDGREAGRRRAPILSEAEFLARRESVDRAMVVRERGDRIQIGVLEDGVLVEHFVTSSGSGSLVGNVYLGRVQNVLPSMEAAFVDIGRGRNAVLYAGEVDWDAAGLEGKARKIEQALSTGDSVLVQVTKDPVGHKGARLTTQISLPGRFLVYVPAGGATGISRKLPENERRRLKDVLKRVVPEDAGVIIRTASEGISEEELARDVRRLQAQWQVIRDRTRGANGTKKVTAPALVYEEPDLLVKVVRDLFTEDFSALVIEGTNAWETVDAYVRHVAPELADRVRKHVGRNDVFAEYRIEEQLLKALDRKVWLPSGGYLVIDRTEAMTVIDVNTGKFTGSGGNLEETVTRNNLESAEEIVRQLRLRDIGGIIVIDFIDMVLESNRDLVLRRLTECLGRDRTRHQVAEVTSLGLVQMTRKRVGTGLLEAFGTTCEHCKGRGVLVSTEPVGKPAGPNGTGQQGGRRSRGRGEDREAAKEAKEAAAKEAAAKEAAKAVRDIAKATSKANGEAQPDDTEPSSSASEPSPEPARAAEPAAVDAAAPAVAGPAVVDSAALEPTAAAEPGPVTSPAPTGRARRRSRRNAGEPTTTVESPEPAVSTVPAGADSFTKTGGRNGGVPEQATEGAQDAEPTADQAELEPAADGSAPPESSASPVSSPPRRPVRRGASRPAGPPVHASNDG
ncbi:translation initiation factor IF-2 N-terminal domain-containing protein [Actinophytocola sp.]|uniref:translation initiation factor IF-2 N-terminal domain-containing protein n=1 Tax=Actinophytocola sp. TaxID=1872138 RepID=UPI003D6A7CA9